VSGVLVSDFLMSRSLWAIGILALLCVALVMWDSSQRFAERERGFQILRAIVRPLQLVSAVDGEVDLNLPLPVHDPLRLEIWGEIRSGVQHVRLHVSGSASAELESQMGLQVNAGNFHLVVVNPRFVRIHKNGDACRVALEVV